MSEFAGLCHIPSSIFHPLSFRHSALCAPHSAIRNPLVASAPAKWLSQKKNIYERTHLWQKTNFAQLLVNENIISN
jgi:hypothetical protein